MTQDCFHNKYTTQQLLHILWDECEVRGLEVPEFNATQRCSIAAALESMGVRF